MSDAGGGARLARPRVALLLAALLLAVTADERVFGLVTDGQIMTRTAYSIFALGELGMARGHPVNTVRPAGDAITRYGIGPTLVRVLPVALAGPWERAFGVGSSQTLFVLMNILFILGAAAAAGSLARGWGGGDAEAAWTILACAIASPLWGYVSSDFSEPLQAALIAALFAAGARSRDPGISARRSLALATAAGAAAGAALLSKSIFIVLIPAAVVLVAWGAPAGLRLRRALAAAAGAAPFAALWLAFEIARFGRPFASYQGEHFNHPVLDGLWRLTVGANKGLFLYFPLALLAISGLRRVFTRDRQGAIVAVGFTGFLIVSTAAWWSWDGTAGWGPRLLVPLVPLLAVLGVLGAAALPALVFRVLFLAGFGLNLLGALHPDAVTNWYYFILPNRKLSPEERTRWPDFAWTTNPLSGQPEVLALHEVARNAAFSPIRLHAFLLARRVAAGDVLGAIRRPPWRTDLPGQEIATPLERAVPASALVFLSSPFRWPHLGMSLTRGAGQVDTVLSYVDCVFDQALRGQDLRDGERAVEFAEKVYGMVPGPRSAQTLAEAYRLANRRAQLGDFVSSLPREMKKSPEFGVVLALAARDMGEAETARANLAAVLRAAPRPEYQRLAALPVSEWPATFREVHLWAAPGQRSKESG
jgi:hypothetical protein